MSTKTTFGWLVSLALLCGSAFCQSDRRNGSNVWTKAQVLALLPVGVDMLDGTVVSNYQELVTAGSRAHEALAEALSETDDPMVMGRIFSVFADSTGDKTAAVKAVRDVIRRFRVRETPDAARTLVFAAQTLGKIGKTEDTSTLLEVVNHKDERVRANAIRALAVLGDEMTAAAIEGFATARMKAISQVDVEKDSSLQEARKAIEMIRRRTVGRGDSK